jgi:hypothetical protein
MYVASPPFIEQLNDMAFWYPIIERHARYSAMPDMSIFYKDGKLQSVEKKKEFVLRTPKTVLLYAPHDIGKIVDGKKTASFDKLVKEITEARDAFGGYAFLRTGQTSNKHDWEKTCYLTPDSDVVDHVGRLVEFSMMVSLPWQTWAVREIIKAKPITTAFWGNMPIAREVRLFAEDGKLLCSHPYWPEEAFRQGHNTDDKVTDEQIKQLAEMPDMEELTKLAEYVSKQFSFAWSIDFLQDIDGNWWLTDMALSNSSYHWPDCPYKDNKNG